MEFDSVKKIVEVEKEAEKMKQDAKQKAKQILEKANNAKEGIYLYHKGQLETKEKELKKEKAEENAKKIAKIQAQTRDTVQKLNDVFTKEASKAVDKIFTKVTNI